MSINNKESKDGSNSSLINGLIPKKAKKAGQIRKAPKIAQDSIPYVEAYENGVMQTEPGVFTKVFTFDDISFKTRSDEEQNQIFEGYMKFLNVMTPKEDVFISIVNTYESGEDKIASIMSTTKNDGFDNLRKEQFNAIKAKMEMVKNVHTEKFLTVRIESNSVDDAMNRFVTIEDDMSSSFRKFAKISLKPASLARRLEVLNSILNSQDENFWFEHDIKGNVSVDYKKMAKQGLTTKDIISPEYLKFDMSSFIIGERYGQAMYMSSIPNVLNTNFFTEIASMAFEGVTTIHIEPVPQEKAIKLIHNQSVNINAEVIEKQKNAIKNGYNPDFIPVDLQKAKEQIDNLQNDIMSRDQKLFFFSMCMVHFAESKEQLKLDGDSLKATAAKYMCSVKNLTGQQERGFISALPNGMDILYEKRPLTTESLAVFIPFDEINSFDKGGFYYGVNAINKSLIVYNRLKGQNYNGLILGSSGSGKSFSAKREMISVMLNTDSDVYIIDPDGEYSPIAEAFGGSIIKIAPGNGVYINPLDLDTDTSHDSDSNPITMKADFVCGMLETMLGGNARLSPTQKSIVDRCIQMIYRPYLEHLAELPPGPDGRKKTIDREFCPTLQNLFEALLSQPQQEAQNLALVMETYTTGHYDTFAHRTNVDLSNRLIIYDIKNIGSNLMELALKVCMNDVWNKMMDNRRSNKWTWFYIDEFHLLLSNDSTSEFLKTVWKRARKWQGVPTGITQNVEDLLASSEARAIINNSSFIYMMNQSAMDRAMLAELVGLTENDIEYITNVDVGCGLISTGKQTIPFQDSFPEDTELYKIMSTKAEDNQD